MSSSQSIFQKLTAVVTGGGSGIGEAIAERLAKDGLHVVVADLDQQSAKQVALAIKNDGGSAEVAEFDVSNLRSVTSMFHSLDRVDVLVNNAGIASIGNVEETSPEEFEKIFSVNVRGVYHCLHAAVPKMVKQGGGVIVNLSSIAAKLGISERFAYSMSKGAVHSMTLSVAKDYVDQGIRCNCVCPARVHTPFVDGYLEDNYPEDEREEMFAKLAKYQPMGRMGIPSEVAALVSFLASPESSFITGSAFDIDGGVTSLR